MAEKRGCGMNTQDENERRVKLALMLSAEMLKNGGETYRAEDCALRVLAAAGSADTQVMAMPTNILVTATFDGQTITRSRSVRVRAVDLGEIDRLNTVSRAYASGMLDLEGAMAAVSAASPPRPVWLMSLYACLSAAFLTCIFGGSWREFDTFFFDHPEIADRCGFFSVLDGVPIGFVSWDPRRLPESVEIGHNCIRSGWKGRGFGTRQMQEAIRRISVARPRKIFVVTSAPLLSAQRMYERAGFRECAREPAAGFPGDRIRYEYFPGR